MYLQYVDDYWCWSARVRSWQKLFYTGLTKIKRDVVHVAGLLDHVEIKSHGAYLVAHTTRVKARARGMVSRAFEPRPIASIPVTSVSAGFRGAFTFAQPWIKWWRAFAQPWSKWFLPHQLVPHIVQCWNNPRRQFVGAIPLVFRLLDQATIPERPRSRQHTSWRFTDASVFPTKTTTSSWHIRKFKAP